ncbi:hypothetical protein HZH68_016130 [Vespula germanica]|uniref:Uncharacterized protein n=1 Tax=Vespula germanica TaxID=30212 RepID=A0A834MQD5_VESGE|nr:hypothetical protein HZH68_016130 [Vespula germanica]
MTSFVTTSPYDDALEIESKTRRPVQYQLYQFRRSGARASKKLDSLEEFLHHEITCPLGATTFINSDRKFAPQLVKTSLGALKRQMTCLIKASAISLEEACDNGMTSDFGQKYFCLILVYVLVTPLSPPIGIA